MKRSATQYKRHRFPPEIIQNAVWLYYRFNLSHRDIEDLLARRGVLVTHESIRFWCNKFAPHYAHRLRRRHRGYGDTLFIDEVFVRIQGRQRYLWRAIDQDGEVVDVLLQERRDAASARRFFRRLLARHPSVREQPGRAVASTDPGTRAGDETVQIHGSGATIRRRARRCHEPLQPGPPLGRSGSLADAASRRLCVMGQGGGDLTAIQQRETAAAQS